MKHLILPPKTSFALGFLLMLATSCAPVRLIGNYDQTTDQTVTALQQKVSMAFVKLQSEAGTQQANYQNYKQFYEAAKVDLNTLKIRASAIDDNKIVQQQIQELTTMVDNLERLHKIGLTNYELVKPLKQPFDSAFSGIIKLQLALKRGEKNK